MFKKLLCLALIAVSIHVLAGLSAAAASTDEEKQARRAEKVKTAIVKLGTGHDARVGVQLRDKTKLAGYISALTDDGFIVTDLNTGAATAVAYPDVKQVQGHNLSTGAKIAIISLSIAAGLLAFFLWLENYG